MPDCQKKDTAKTKHKRNNYTDANYYKIARGMLISEKSMEYMLVQLDS